MKSPVAYWAAAEKRVSGCGFHPIRLHWHFVMSTLDAKAAQLYSTAGSLWKQKYGEIHIRPYDPHRHGAFYLAKTADRADAHHLFAKLDRLTYGGPTDLHRAARESPYVPDHAKTSVVGETLTLQIQRRHSRG